MVKGQISEGADGFPERLRKADSVGKKAALYPLLLLCSSGAQLPTTFDKAPDPKEAQYAFEIVAVSHQA
ncbi:MAG: hypothetical protein N838_20545 [Thiohalocapsa sp. PB-PSB1]|nr:MAG: hypothetical protein N838_20545 [Thiohalocapsa sp. PB-PSB1]